jgi:hypothetical protein
MPLVRLPAPVLGSDADGQTLPPLFAAAGQNGATPLVGHPFAEAVLIDAPPVSRPICRTHGDLT